MTKKLLNQNAKYDQKFIDKIEPNFVFENKPINRLKIIKKSTSDIEKDRKERIIELKRKINSIQNCNLRNNSKNLIMGDGKVF